MPTSSYTASVVRSTSQQAVVAVTAIHTLGNRVNRLESRYGRHSWQYNKAKLNTARSLSELQTLAIHLPVLEPFQFTLKLNFTTGFETTTCLNKSYTHTHIYKKIKF